MAAPAGARWHADPFEGRRKTGAAQRRRSAPSHRAHPGRGAAGAGAQARGGAACAAAISAAEAGGCMSVEREGAEENWER